MADPTRFITVETADRVTTITLNRPAVMNAINPEMHAELQVAFDDFAADPGGSSWPSSPVRESGRSAPAAT